MTVHQPIAAADNAPRTAMDVYNRAEHDFDILNGALSFLDAAVAQAEQGSYSPSDLAFTIKLVERHARAMAGMVLPALYDRTGRSA